MAQTRAWLVLLALSAASTLLSFGLTVGWGQHSLKLSALAILAIAWAKARIIANRYLGLCAAPPFLRGFSIVLALYLLTLMALYLLA